MAGGEGRRLRPLTNKTPKSLLRVGDHPLLEHTLLQLRRYGIDDVTLAVNYLASMIQDYFGSGEQLGMNISYLHENSPLGTAGAMAHFSDFEDTIVVMNGDLMTDLNFAEMLALHRSRGAILTVASKVMYTDLSLGVLDLDERGLISGYREKPRLEHRFGIGIYIVEPAVKAFVQPGQRLDMPDLITKLISQGRTVACYDHLGKWTDIGLPEDYAKAQEQARQHAVTQPAIKMPKLRLTGRSSTGARGTESAAFRPTASPGT